MFVYRLEHRESTLGPFQHGGQIEAVIREGIWGTADVMSDLELLPKVQALLKYDAKNIRFGFTNKRSFRRMIRNVDTLKQYGFIALRIKVRCEFISQCRQVVYLESSVENKEELNWQLFS